MDLKFKIAELDHVVLRCADQARALEFYTGVLGMTEERRLESIGLIQLRAGASMLDLVPGAHDKERRNVDHFCLGVDTGDIAAFAAHLRERGVDVIGEPALRYGARGSGLSIYIHDPEGNVVELKQMPADGRAA